MISGRRPDAQPKNTRSPGKVRTGRLVRLCFLWPGTSRDFGSRERNYAGPRKDTGKPSVHKLSLLVRLAMLALALAFFTLCLHQWTVQLLPAWGVSKHRPKNDVAFVKSTKHPCLFSLSSARSFVGPAVQIFGPTRSGGRGIIHPIAAACSLHKKTSYKRK